MKDWRRKMKPISKGMFASRANMQTLHKDKVIGPPRRKCWAANHWFFLKMHGTSKSRKSQGHIVSNSSPCANTSWMGGEITTVSAKL